MAQSPDGTQETVRFEHLFASMFARRIKQATKSFRTELGASEKYKRGSFANPEETSSGEDCSHLCRI